MPKKIIPIKYTSRDYQSIRADLVEHAKRYYADSHKDFNEGSFGSLMIDTVSYIGDILSFYLDYQANECFLETASEYNNVLKLAKQMGFKYSNGKSSTGVASFYIVVPANSIGLGPDTRYLPTLQKGSTFSTRNNVKFILTEDVVFNSTVNEIRPAVIGANGTPTSYAVKANGTVISGIVKSETIPVGEYQKFLKVELSEQNIVEILSIYDSEGNQYYEVDYLTQNVIYRSITNRDAATSDTAKEILKPLMVPRRFTVETEINKTYLQFGASSDVVVSDNNNMIADPGIAVLELFGKQYISSDSFDPTRLTSSDKLGIAPSQTNLIVTYRYTPVGSIINFSVNSLTNVDSSNFVFKDERSLDATSVSSVRRSLEVNNDAPILGEVTAFDSNELKIRIQSAFSAQSRAVTAEDYKALAYGMPAKYGSIKRVNVIRDDDSLKRNLNMYVLCENSSGYLTYGNQIVKNNLKTWLSRNKMINDSIDILDGKIVNYGIKFKAVASPDRPKYDVLTDAINQLKLDFAQLPDFGESLFVSKVLTSLKKVDGLLDVVSVEFTQKAGGSYSNVTFDFKRNMPNNRYLEVPNNVVMELKYPNSDIEGSII